AYIVIPYVSAASSDLSGDLNDLQKERERLEKELNKIENKRDSELEKKEIIDKQINAVREEINIANQQLDLLNDELSDANEKLEEVNESYNEAFDASKEYIRMSYEGGTVSNIEIILSSGSVTEFITRVEIVNEIMSYQRSVIKKLKESKTAIEATQKAIQEKQQKQQSVTDALESKKDVLDTKQAASDEMVASFNDKEDELNSLIEEVERQEKELQEEIRQQLAQSNNNSGSSNVPVSDGFLYPLDSKWRIITSPFGNRVHPTTGVYKLHTGVDISGSGIYGANIYASKNGTVLKGGYHRAYGNYCLINHGDGTATLYAHMSTLMTSVGSTVTQGQVIGKVGSTGYSTGAHLHFEILVNGNYVNPLPYFPSMNFIYS
ncbi:MAG: peptidoglycan DD-metalloendopeptidase family protein, partial [Clostridia bacterium]|nr:peptidoglycan DD-metalloendopeptidase family protein [Clostridia bacterium]